MSISNPCLQCGQDPCSQCPQTPCIPIAPPPSCGLGSAACDEYISSDCVLNSFDGSCTVTIQTPTGPVTVGLQITEGMTLTQILSQLTSTACLFDPNMIQGFWTSIFNNTTLFEWIVQNFFNGIINNSTLNQYFTDLICDIDCQTPCDILDEVEQMIFTNIDIDKFDLTWIAMPGYTYYIRINDSQSIPVTYYEYTTPTPPALGTVPVSNTLNTASFIKYENGVVVPNNGLASNTSFEVYITAMATIGGDQLECETGPFTINTLEDTSCASCNTTIDVQNSNTVPAALGELSVDISYQSGFIPIGYNIIVTSVTTGLVVNGPPTGVVIPPTTPGFITNYNIPLPADNYSVLVTPICTNSPLCIGNPDTVVITVNPPAFCAPPDITSVSIN